MGIRKFEISAKFLVDMGQGTFEIVHNPLPEDAKVVGGSYNPFTQSVCLAIESKEYTPVENGALVPNVLPPVIRRL